ncbi:MAG: tRNA pseudouridine(54/55) synthase Pus10, partial [Candidatus Thorarchaeota archaeon]
ALMLGDGRPFVVEVTEPRIRSLNLAEIATNINTRASGKIEVDHLEFSDRQQSQVLKMASSTNVKEYRALIEVEHELSDEALSLAESGLSGTVIEQRTPLRVLHRRSDRVRKKTIYEVRLVRQGGPRLEGFFKVQGGTYVKELISGDEGRTRPSVAELLGVKTRCVELSVVAIRDQDSDHNT